MADGSAAGLVSTGWLVSLEANESRAAGASDRANGLRADPSPATARESEPIAAGATFGTATASTEASADADAGKSRMGATGTVTVLAATATAETAAVTTAPAAPSAVPAEGIGAARGLSAASATVPGVAVASIAVGGAAGAATPGKVAELETERMAVAAGCDGETGADGGAGGAACEPTATASGCGADVDGADGDATAGATLNGTAAIVGDPGKGRDTGSAEARTAASCASALTGGSPSCGAIGTAGPGRLMVTVAGARGAAATRSGVRAAGPAVDACLDIETAAEVVA